MIEETTSSRDRAADPLERRGPYSALVTAGGILAVLLVQALLLLLVNLVKTAAYLAPSGEPGNSVGSWVGDVLAQLVGDSFTAAIPFAAGVFLSLWRLLPITADLRLASAAARAIVAAVVGGLAAVAASVLVAIALGLSGVVPFLGDVAGGIVRAGSDIWLSVLSAVLGSLSALILNIPLVLLAGLLLWGWLRRHPLPPSAPTVL